MILTSLRAVAATARLPFAHVRTDRGFSEGIVLIGVITFAGLVAAAIAALDPSALATGISTALTGAISGAGGGGGTGAG